MVNYIKLAEALGVQMNEPFAIPFQNKGPFESAPQFKIMTYGILCRGAGNKSWMGLAYTTYADNLTKYLTGVLSTMYKANIEPSNGQKYWSYSGNDWAVTEYTWTGSLEDIARLNLGTTFGSRKNAVGERGRIYKKVTGKEWTIKSPRTCTHCGSPMWNGYCIHDGEAYYCSDKCLYANMSEKDYDALYENDSAYWTEWTEEE